MVMAAERLAIDGGTPVRSAPFPSWPVVDKEDEATLLAVLQSGQWGSHSGGGRVAAFEREFASFQQAAHGVAVTNGTAALEVALRACGVGIGDEVIVPPYTFVATASACLTLGAFPVFVDIDPETYAIDPARVEEAITPRTKAIIAVHIGGGPADMDGVLDVAKRHGLRVIEDAAQAHGAAWRGRRVGAIGNAGTFSFQSSKNLTAGEGGIVLTDDPQLADLAWSVANVGRRRSSGESGWYQHDVLGSNYRLTEFQGALLLSQLRRLPEQIAHRERMAARLTAGLNEVPGFRPVQRDPRVTTHAWHLYMCRYDAGAFGGRPRQEFLAALRAEGIPCSSGYTPLYRAPAIRKAVATLEAALGRSGYAALLSPERCPVNEWVCNEGGVWFTQRMLLGSERDVDDIVAAVRKVQRAFAR
jgi:dTDP-4-amino-4,6-dideoxygalactose transaminase